MADLYMVVCEKCGFEVPVVLNQPPKVNETTICDDCKGLDN